MEVGCSRKAFLEKTVRGGSIEKISEIFEESDYSDIINETFGVDKSSILHIAISESFSCKTDEILEKKLDFLIERKADPNFLDKYGNNLILHASKLDKIDILPYLFKICDRYHTNYYGMTLLHVAASRGHFSVLEKVKSMGGSLIEELVSKQTTQKFKKHFCIIGKTLEVDGWTALHFAAMGCHLRCIKWLMHNGANIKQTDSNQFTPVETLEKFSEQMSNSRRHKALQCIGALKADRTLAMRKNLYKSSIKKEPKGASPIQSARGQSETAKRSKVPNDDESFRRRERLSSSSRIIRHRISGYLEDHGLTTQIVLQILKGTLLMHYLKKKVI